MDLAIFLQRVPDAEETWAQMLFSGLGWTLSVAALAWVMAFLVGSAVGMMRTSGRRGMARCGSAWVELFRNIPLIVQFFVWYFVVPGLLPPVKAWVITLDPTWHQFLTAVVCLGCFTSSRIAEQVRAGIESLPRGQRDAARALGLNRLQTYRHVLLPQTYRIILPPLTSELMNLIKNTAVAYSIGLVELFFRTREMGEMTFRYFEAFAAATLIYLAVSLTANRAMALIERRTAIPGHAAGRR
jgi:glutamate/aspartate transport system permease protein